MKLAYTDSAMNTFLSLDKTIQKRVKKYMDEVQKLDNPRAIEVMHLQDSYLVCGDIVWGIGELFVK